MGDHLKDTGYFNKYVKALITARRAKHITTPVAHPQCNPVGHVNRTIKPRISAVINDRHKEWVENFSRIQLAYNIVPHSGNKISPFYLNHGHKAVIEHVTKSLKNKRDISTDCSVDYWISEWVK